MPRPHPRDRTRERPAQDAPQAPEPTAAPQSPESISTAPEPPAAPLPTPSVDAPDASANDAVQ
jgi:hypothetical protein